MRQRAVFGIGTMTVTFTIGLWVLPLLGMWLYIIGNCVSVGTKENTKAALGAGFILTFSSLITRFMP